MKKFHTYLIAVLLVFSLLTPIGSQINTVTATAAAITISSKSIALEVGKTQTLTISGTKKKITWSSNKKTVAIVDSKGKVTAKAAGAAIITAKVDGKVLTCTVSVYAPVAISSADLKLEAGKSSTLKIKNINYRPVWKSANEAVAVVSSEGKVTGVAAGTTTITANADGKKLSCKVTITKPQGISEYSFPVLVKEKTDPLTTPVVTGAAIQWESSNASIAKTSADGTVTGVKEGNALITATIGEEKYTYLAVVLNTANPYVKKTTFYSKEITYKDLSYVVPSSWTTYRDDYSDYSYTITYPSGYDDSCIEITTSESDIKYANYKAAKKAMTESINEDAVRKAYEDFGDYYGVTIKIKNFKQSDMQTDFGKALKTEFTVTVAGQSLKVVSYDFYMDGYVVDVSVSIDGNKKIQSVAETLVDSFIVK